MSYQVDYRCSDDDPIQRTLNALNCYADDTETKVYHRKRLNLIYEMLGELKTSGHIKRLGDAVDIGCGCGFCSKMISDFGFARVVGIDIERVSIESANRNFAFRDGEKTVEFKVARAEALELSSGYDFVLCTEVIEHVDRPEDIVERIHVMLNPDGVALVTVPNLVSIPFLGILAMSKIRGNISPVMQSHLNFPFYKTISLLEKAGFEIVRLGGTNLILNEKLMRFIYRKDIFPAINRADSWLSMKWPFYYCTQFLFVVVRKKRTS